MKYKTLDCATYDLADCFQVNIERIYDQARSIIWRELNWLLVNVASVNVRIYYDLVAEMIKHNCRKAGTKFIFAETSSFGFK